MNSKSFSTVVFCSAIALFTSEAFAAPEKISLTCNARQALVGGTKTGKVIINASTDGIATFGNPWKVDVAWEGETSSLVKEGVSCGQTLPANTECYERRSLPGLTFTLHQRCGKTIYRGSVPHSSYISSIVFDGSHGYFNCESPAIDQKRAVHMHVELQDCKETPASADPAMTSSL